MGNYSSMVGAATFIIIFFGSNIVKHLGEHIERARVRVCPQYARVCIYRRRFETQAAAALTPCTLLTMSRRSAAPCGCVAAAGCIVYTKLYIILIINYIFEAGRWGR